MIIRARVVVPIDRSPIENGAVAISGNRIAAVGKFSDVKAEPSPYPLPEGEDEKVESQQIVDLGDSALLPGLINAHCHLDYTCLRGKIPRPKSFTDWIAAINAEKAKLSAKDYVESMNEGFSDAQQYGTTTIANLTAFPELIAQIQEPIRTWWFAELIDVRDPTTAHEVVHRAAANLTPLSSQVSGALQHWGLAPHAPFTASPNLYRFCEEIAERENILLTTHLAESRDEMSMFRDALGPLYEFLKKIGRDMSDCGGRTPVQSFVSANDSPNHRPRYLLVHLNELAENDFDLLTGSQFSAVHCPRSHDYFGHSQFQFEKLKRAGINVCLGTDSLASNDDFSLFAEMRAFQKDFPNVPAAEILAMATANAARALEQENMLGKIAPGFSADLIAVPCNEATKASDEIVAFNQPVHWSMIAGAIQPN
jgi:cytosine/adenosine deaminase-related metal-dependent hydrolase